MATLGDLMAIGDINPSGASSDRAAYLDYVEACQLANKTPLPYDKWVAAGKPAK